MPGQTFEIPLSTFVYGGDVMGRLPDGRAVFVPFALPGEVVRIELVEEKRSHARARLLDVLEPVSQRIFPRCIHFGTCGGCHYQHLPYPVQLEIKRSILRDQLERIGSIQEPVVNETVPSPLPWYYRNNVQFHLTSNGALGYYQAMKHEVFKVEECHLPEEAINDTWPRLDLEPVSGLERVEVRTDTSGEVLVVFESTDPQPPEFEADLPLSAVYHGPDGMAVLSGDEYLVIEVLGQPFKVSAGSFFQVNTIQAGNMVNYLLERLPLSASTLLLDIYCGAGLFSRFMAPRVGRCIGIELSPYAVEDFSVNLDEFENVEIYQGAAEEILPHLTLQPDVIIVDPPRAGLERKALDALVKMRSQVLVYISCDPATLARDAKRLTQAGYRLEDATPFDLFPQTFHIESISCFRWMGG